jgi:pentatricopeptide repeat protein
MKKIVPLLLLLCLFLPVESTGEDLYESQLNRGIRNSEPYAYLLIKESKTDKTHAKNILREAVRYAPDLPAVYFELSKASFSFKPEGVFETVDYLLMGIAAYQRNFWWSFMTISSLFTSLILSFVLSVFIIVLVRLPKDMPLFSHDLQEDKTLVLSLLVLFFAVFGPLFFLGGLLILISFYMKRWDRIVLYLYLIFLLISPFLFKTISFIFNAPVSGELKSVVQVNESIDNRYALSLLRDKNNPVELFSYALALKREGRYHEAIAIYNRLIARKPDPQTYNNLANCYVALNEMEKAKEFYKKANEMKPLPLVLYNLSQVYRETLDFDKGEEYFLSAQKLDPDAVSSFRSIAGRNPNRFVIDEGLPVSVLLKYAQENAATASFPRYVTVTLAIMPIVALIMIIFSYLLENRQTGRAYRCNRCGKILCSKCEKHLLWGRMCLQCYRSLVKIDELDAKERIARILKVYEYQKKRRDILKTISFIIPGLSQIFAGNIFPGLLFLWPFFFFLLIPVTNSIFVIEMSFFSHFWLNTISIFVVVMIYILSNVITRRRIAKGWL